MSYSIADLATLSRLTRWQNVPTVQSESVAEHTAQVALIVVLLREHLDFDLGCALTIAVLHDVAEIDLTDIPHNVARRFPSIAKAKREAEHEVLAQKLPKYKDLLLSDSLEAQVVKLADTLQVCQFAKSELKLSNSKYMAQVLSEATASARELEAKLNAPELVDFVLTDL